MLYIFTKTQKFQANEKNRTIDFLGSSFFKIKN